MTNQEINEAVARKLGLRPRPCENAHKQNEIQPGYHSCSLETRDYSTSIEAAWEVVEHLKEIYHGGEAYKLTYDSVDKEWSAWVDSVIGTADTAPMAICKAFLKLDAVEAK